METGINTGNGLAWNSTNTLLFYIDSPTGKVDVFDYESEAGTISNRRTVFDFSTAGERGLPDGMTIDANNNLIVGCWGGNQVSTILFIYFSHIHELNYVLNYSMV